MPGQRADTSFYDKCHHLILDEKYFTGQHGKKTSWGGNYVFGNSSNVKIVRGPYGNISYLIEQAGSEVNVKDVFALDVEYYNNGKFKKGKN